MIEALLRLLTNLDYRLAPLRKRYRRWRLERLFFAFYCTTSEEREEFIAREDAANLAARTLGRYRDEDVSWREAWVRGTALYKVAREAPPPPRKGSGKWAGL